MKNLIDLVVVGAGPAGLMTAKIAAELGLRVTLIEKIITSNSCEGHVPPSLLWMTDMKMNSSE